jgi:NAD(P)-dependent dehydrogenase (short-subunit alcohol dehydrogenase family)
MSRITSLSRLDGRRALITGATGGIGRVVAQTLAELGAELILSDRPGADFGPLLTHLAAESPAPARVVICDLEHDDDRARLIADLRAAGPLDILINNAAFVGTSNLTGWVGPLATQSIDTWRRALEVNLTAAFHLSQGVADQLRLSGHGAIVNIGSIYGMLGPDHRLYDGTELGNPAAYAASKGGLLQLTRWLATTLAPTVRVNMISPGGVARHQPDVFVERYVARTPLGRMATEDDVRGAVAYLASDLSAYVTGHNLAVDGGWGIW